MIRKKVIEEKIKQAPIQLPGNPFWEVLRVFGRDELAALLSSTVATLGVSFFSRNPLILSLTGPVVEKVGFFLPYLKNRNFYQGFSSLLKDLAVHDPLYTVLMYWGLTSYPNVPIWLLVIGSFAIAVLLVSIGEVTYREVSYQLQIFRLHLRGFNRVSYLEARFYIRGSQGRQILNNLSRRFGLKRKSRAAYQDLYFQNTLKNYNGRTPIVRFRKRGKEIQKGDLQSVQIVYTRAGEASRNKPQQFNYYLTRKDKLYYQLKQAMPKKVSEIKNEKIRSTIKAIARGPSHPVKFWREVVRNPKTILVSVDEVKIPGGRKFTVVEIKSHLDKRSRQMLVAAMQELMFRYEVIQITHSKSSLTALDKS